MAGTERTERTEWTLAGRRDIYIPRAGSAEPSEEGGREREYDFGAGVGWMLDGPGRQGAGTAWGWTSDRLVARGGGEAQRGVDASWGRPLALLALARLKG